MKKNCIKEGNFNRVCALFLSFVGITVIYSSIFYVENRILKLVLIIIGLGIGYVGKFSGDARVFNLKPFDKPVTRINDSVMQDKQTPKD